MKKICQSCGMPMAGDSLLGTNADGTIKNGTIQYTMEDSPFIGYAISFPHSEVRDNAVTYAVNRVAEYAETEDNFDNEDDNNYDGE